MHMIALGMNHRTADIAMREKIAGASDCLLALNAEIMHAAAASGCVLIATCNRTEIYMQTKSLHKVLKWFAHKLEVPESELCNYTYMHLDLDAIRHLMNVASGLDSLVLGEVEILGQLKGAYKVACQQGSMTTILSKLFECAFYVAKKVRSQTEIGVNPISVAYLAVRLAQKIFNRLSEQQILVIGAGETAQLILKHLCAAGASRFIIANRTLANANQVAASLEGNYSIEAIELELIPQALKRCDIVIAATNASLPLVGKGMVEMALKVRKYKPMFMLDLGVPRNIEPQVQQIADVFLYGIDDLQDIASKHQAERYKAVPEARKIIDAEVHKFVDWLDLQNAVQTIRAFRKRCEYTRDQALDEALQELSVGKNPEQVLQRFAHVLLNRLLHEPTVQLRRASIEGNVEILELMRELFET